MPISCQDIWKFTKTYFFDRPEALTSQESSFIGNCWRSAQAAYEGATHADAKAENKYDTRGLESSYLAGAQKERAADLQASIQAIRLMVLQQFSASDPIAPSAVICLEQDDRTTWCFLVTLGGGFNLTWEGQNLTTVTTQSPLGQRLVGKECGDEIALTIAGTKKTYTIASVA